MVKTLDKELEDELKKFEAGLEKTQADVEMEIGEEQADLKENLKKEKEAIKTKKFILNPPDIMEMTRQLVKEDFPDRFKHVEIDDLLILKTKGNTQRELMRKSDGETELFEGEIRNLPKPLREILEEKTGQHGSLPKYILNFMSENFDDEIEKMNLNEQGKRIKRKCIVLHELLHISKERESLRKHDSFEEEFGLRKQLIELDMNKRQVIQTPIYTKKKKPIKAIA